jgi:protein-tyrosine kinase
MSRIEAAMKRAEADGASPGPVPLEATPVADQTVLSRFPRESGGDRPRPAPDQPRVLTVLPRRSSAAAEEPEPEPPDLRHRKLVISNAAPVAVEQYRRLAAALHEMQVTHGTKVLMVTSALPEEGKTLTVTNLALTLSESYHCRVLLIDADFRRPSLHRLLGVPGVRGLSTGMGTEEAGLSLVEVTPHLTLLPAGRPEADPMARLTSDRMRGLLEEAAASFDWVLLDAPPVGIIPDAALLATLTQGVIFVIAAGATPYPLIERAIGELGRESIVGIVLNRVDGASIPATAYYDQYYGAASRAE